MSGMPLLELEKSGELSKKIARQILENYKGRYTPSIVKYGKNLNPHLTVSILDVYNKGFPYDVDKLATIKDVVLEVNHKAFSDGLTSLHIKSRGRFDGQPLYYESSFAVNGTGTRVCVTEETFRKSGEDINAYARHLDWIDSFLNNRDLPKN